MLKLRKFLCGWFGFLAVVFLMVSITSVPRMLHPLQPRGFPGSVQNTHVSWALAIVLHVFIRLLQCMPLVLGAVYGMAWWTAKSGKRSARAWAIAASLGMLILSLPLLTALFFILAYSPRMAIGFLIFDGLVVALGIAGLVAFGRRDSMVQPVYPAKPPRIAGDGTSRLLDGVAGFIGFGGYIAGRYLWVQWGHARGISMNRGSFPLVLIVVALLLTVFLHESGHALTGLVLGMKVRAFIVGPFQWRIRDGRWTFKFNLAQFFSAGGATAVVPTNPWQPRWREICMIAAGALVNLVTGLIAGYAALVARGQPYEQYWHVLTIFCTLSLVTFAVNLIPFRPEAAYSDGARIYQLLWGGPWADLHRTFSIVTSTLVTPLRPRDFDIDAIQRAKLSFTQGNQALLLRLFATSYFIDCRMISQACDAVAEAERIYQESASDIPAELHADFVFDNAFLCRDAAKARLWWDRMEAKKPTHFGVDYWLAQSALCWIEGRREEATVAWEKGNLLAQRLPAAGGYEFDRYRYALLHQCLEKKEAVEAG
jgi:hypothetical protein